MSGRNRAPAKTGIATASMDATANSRLRALVHRRTAGQRGRRLRQLAARSRGTE